jgi:uncharacterized protein (DUF58 family)
MATARTDPDEEEAANLGDILREVRKIEIITRGLVRESVGGEYHSSFKGQGIDFDDLREYQFGDEVRSIDWNTTARLGQTFIKKFVEEREMTVFLAIDVSASGNFGSIKSSKRRLAATIAAVFAFSALQNQDKVGLILFSDNVELYLPPRKGSAHVLRLIREILMWKPHGHGTDPSTALNVLIRSIHRRALVFLVSDFICADFQRPLRTASVKHDIVAVHIADPAEEALPDIGRVRLQDPETGQQLVVNTSNPVLAHSYREARRRWREELDQSFRKLGIDKIDLSTDPDESFMPALHAFFKRRENRAH